MRHNLLNARKSKYILFVFIKKMCYVPSTTIEIIFRLITPFDYFQKLINQKFAHIKNLFYYSKLPFIVVSSMYDWLRPFKYNFWSLVPSAGILHITRGKFRRFHSSQV